MRMIYSQLILIEIVIFGIAGILLLASYKLGFENYLIPIGIIIFGISQYYITKKILK